jgi:glutathione synthase/RimK-type ligase-like ATP-grasp enzyme
MAKKVVLFTYTGDSPYMIDALAQALAQRGAELLRFDSDRFPMECRADFVQDGGVETIAFSDGEKRVILDDGDAIWYRRARYAAGLPMQMDVQLRRACIEESETLLRGLMAAAPCFVLDPPDLVKLRGHKPWQQRIARELGLHTPRTLMTGDPAQAEAFLRSCELGAIAKMQSAFAIYTEDQTEQVVFTTALNEAHVRKLEGLRYCPMVFQERIEKRIELRITAIGNRLYAAAVDSQTTPGAEVDWRERGVTLIKSWAPYTLPADIESRLHAYMDRIGMQYSAIDMLVEPSGRHVFLEANPAGEFFWLEHNAPRFPFTAAIADILTNQPGARRHAARS